MSMENDSAELGLYVEGEAALIVGDDADIDALIERIWADDARPKSVSMTKDALAAVSAATGFASQSQANGGKWVKLTEESAAKLRDLAVNNPPKNGVMAGVIRGPKGRINQHAKFVMPGGGTPNPLMMSNAATLAMSMAIQVAIEDLRKYLETMDVKLDKLLQNDRAEAMGEIRGITRIMSEAFDMYQETGRVSSVSWDKVQHHPTSLASFVAQSVEQIESMTEKISQGSVSDKAKSAARLAKEELSFWLSILAISLANQKRFHVLELARVNQEHPEDAEIHREVTAKHNEAMGLNVSRAIKRLSDALEDAGSVGDLARVLQPIPARSLVQAVNSAHGQVDQFVSITELDALSWGDATDKGWGRSVADVAQKGGAAVGSSVKGLFGGARNAAERAVLKQAKRIETERSARAAEKASAKDLENQHDES
jgi:hypothetical protein